MTENQKFYDSVVDNYLAIQDVCIKYLNGEINSNKAMKDIVLIVSREGA